MKLNEYAKALSRLFSVRDIAQVSIGGLATLREVFARRRIEPPKIFLQRLGSHDARLYTERCITRTPFREFTKWLQNGQINTMEIADIRRRTTQSIVDELTLTGAAKRFNLPTRQLLDMLQGRKSFGEKVARRMEQSFAPERPSGWLDQAQYSINTDHDASIVAEPAAEYVLGDIRIPQYETGGSMGHGVVLADQPGVIKQWTVSERWLQMNVQRITSAKNLAIVTGFGPSMQPLFNPGDPLLVDKGVKCVDTDGVYFFRVGDEGFVKQLQRIPTIKGLVLRAKSYNPLYDPFDIVDGMDFEVFARVVKVWKGEDF